jgi:thiol-disulfide isomerase/thioredoxin
MILRIELKICVAFIGALSLLHVGYGQPYPQGTISPDFTITNRLTGEPFNLYDLEGQVIILDFFAFWCPPCAFSSPDLEENIQKRFAALGGNESGIPVTVVSVNIEPEDANKTDEFIAEVGAELVIDDFDSIYWNAYNITNGLPLLSSSMV